MSISILVNCSKNVRDNTKFNVALTIEEPLGLRINHSSYLAWQLNFFVSKVRH